MNKPVVQSAAALVVLAALSFIAASISVGSPIEVWWSLASAACGIAALILSVVSFTLWLDTTGR